MNVIGGRDVGHLDVSGKDRDLVLKIYETLWRAIERENNLINQRLTWPITLTSAFIVAESFLARPIFEQFSSGKFDVASPSLCFVVLAISLLGAFFSWKAKRSVEAAIEQVGILREYYNDCRTGDGANLFEKELFLPRPHGERNTHLSGTEAAKTFPRVLVIGWCALSTFEGIAFIFLVAKVALKAA